MYNILEKHFFDKERIEKTSLYYISCILSQNIPKLCLII